MKAFRIFSILLMIVGCQEQRASQSALGALPADSASPAIIGGVEVDSSELISKVAVKVLFVNERGVKNFCSGTLLAQNFALIAAHCLIAGKAVAVQSFLGSQTPVQKVVAHPLYQAEASGNRFDLALVEFTPDQDFQIFAELVQQDETQTSHLPLLLAAGYGRTEHNQKSAGRLFKIQVLSLYPEYFASEFLVEFSKNQGPSFGDSGGPLYQIKQGKVILWGVDSHRSGKYEVQGKVVEIYSKISGSTDWIRQSLGQ